MGNSKVGNIFRSVGSLGSMFGPYGAIFSGLGAIGGGIVDMATGAKQSEQEKIKAKEAMAMKPLPPQKEQMQKLRAIEFASRFGLPNYELAKNALNEQAAQGVRGIRQTAPTGGAALEAISNVGINQNAALNQLSIQDAIARMEKEKEFRGTLGEIGGIKDAQRARTDALQQAMLTQREKLANAATYNKALGIKTILGAVGQGLGAATALNKKGGATDATGQQTNDQAADQTTDQQDTTTQEISAQEADQLANDIINADPTITLEEAYNMLIQKGYKWQ